MRPLSAGEGAETGGIGPAPLAGVRVIETGGIGPNPFAGMFLAELGAEVARVDRPSPPDSFAVDPRFDLLNRGKRSIVLDLRRTEAVRALLAMVERADVLTEGFRPGVMERLGLGPQDCWQRNPRLVYGRMTGWGQDGPLSNRAGHDINYIGVTGILEAIGEADRPPQIPLTVIDGAAPFYGVYETSDHRYLAVGAIERRFYQTLLRVLGLDEDASRQYDPATWPQTRERIAAVFRTRTQAEWTEQFSGTDACLSPVVSLAEAAASPQILARGSVVTRGGTTQPAPAPGFSGFEPPDPAPPPQPGEHTREILIDWGVPEPETLIASGAAVQLPCGGS